MIFDNNVLNDDCALCGNCIFWLPSVISAEYGFCLGYRDHVYCRKAFKSCDRFVHSKKARLDLQTAHERYGIFTCSDWIKGGMPK